MEVSFCSFYIFSLAEANGDPNKTAAPVHTPCVCSENELGEFPAEASESQSLED